MRLWRECTGLRLEGGVDWELGRSDRERRKLMHGKESSWVYGVRCRMGYPGLSFAFGGSLRDRKHRTELQYRA